MSWMNAVPDHVAAAANDLASIGSSLSAANSSAAFPTSAVVAPGGDEVSAVIAALFGAHAQAYQELSAQAASFHQQFVEAMTGGAAQYAAAEARNATPLQ
ncbi:PE family protein [Mycobacterium kubicae]|nr:PE family protein [Mycobacterium kubicae]